MMKTTATLVLSLVFVAALAGTAPAVRQHYSHQDDYFEHYEGTRTCLECHEQEAQDFFHSQHYQWRGKTPNVVNADGMELGKLNTMNDFCTNPNPSWIGNAVNEPPPFSSFSFAATCFNLSISTCGFGASGSALAALTAPSVAGLVAVKSIFSNLPSSPSETYSAAFDSSAISHSGLEIELLFGAGVGAGAAGASTG